MTRYRATLIGFTELGDDGSLYNSVAVFHRGSVTGVYVDNRDHVWITHLPETLTEEELYEEQKPPMGTCCKAAPGA